MSVPDLKKNLESNLTIAAGARCRYSFCSSSRCCVFAPGHPPPLPTSEGHRPAGSVGMPLGGVGELLLGARALSERLLLELPSRFAPPAARGLSAELLLSLSMFVAVVTGGYRLPWKHRETLGRKTEDRAKWQMRISVEPLQENSCM